MTLEQKRAWAQEQLRSRQAELGRTPHKDDFDEVTRARIKAFLGPWPRALEAAGLKDVRPAQKNQKNKGSLPRMGCKIKAPTMKKGVISHEKDSDPGCSPDVCIDSRLCE